MWTVPHRGGLGGIAGMHYFSQMSWPVGLFVLLQLPDHLHNGLMWPLHQPICLGVVRHGSQFPHAEDVTHLINDAAHKFSTPITQEPGWGPKDWDVTLYRNLATVLAVWLGVTYAITCFVKWSWNTRILTTLGSLFSSMVISMLVKSTCKRSNGVVATIRCRGTLDTSPSHCKQCTQD